MDNPILNRIVREGFTPFGWFVPEGLEGAQFAILIGNAGPAMFARFSIERNGASMDEWTKKTVNALAKELDAKAVYPFDKPYLPFQQWARRCGQGFASPLGINIHPTFGLWHAYRAVLLFSVQFDFPRNLKADHPCESCTIKPCLNACPVLAFDGKTYDVEACASHLHAQNTCMDNGCKARLACPIGTAYQYRLNQMQFHMKAFKDAHAL